MTNETKTAVLSKLRAPVADERVSPPLPAAWGSAINDAGDGHVDLYSAEQMQEYARAALASAPVTEDDEVERIRGLGPAYPYTPNTAPPTPLAIAPVAGEAKNYPGENVAERLDNMADDQPPGSQAQSDLYAAATIWRKHIAHRAAPQASTVAREAQLLAVAWRINAAEARAYGKVATAATLEECARELESLDAAPSARAELRAIRERQPDNADILALLWEIKRMRSLLLRLDQVSCDLRRPSGLMGDIYDELMQHISAEPCVVERKEWTAEILEAPYKLRKGMGPR